MLVLFSVASFVEVIAYGQLNAFTPLWLPTLGIRPENVAVWVAAISAGSNVIGVLFLPFWGVFADRFGRKPLIIRSFAASGLGMLVGGLATTVWMFTLGRGLTALALGNGGLMMTTLAESAPAARLGVAYGVLNGAGPFGAVVGPLLAGPLVDRYGFGAVLVADATLLLAVVLMLAFGYRDAFRRPASPPPILRSALGGAGLLWHSPRLRILFPAFLVMFSGWIVVLVYTPLAVARIASGPDIATAIGLVAGAGGLVTLVLSPSVGALADRAGLVRMFFIVGSVSAVAWLLPWGVRDYTPFLVAFAIANGIGSAIFSLQFNVLSKSTTDATRARVMTFAYLPLNLGFIFGPTLGSIVAARDPFGIYPLAGALEATGLVLVAIALRQPVEAQPVPN